MGIICLMLNISTLNNFNRLQRISEWIDVFQKKEGRKPSKEDFNEEDFKLFGQYSLQILIYVLWVFVGLLSNSWIIYLVLITQLSISSYIFKLIGPYKRLSKHIKFINLFIGTLVLLFLIINHFQLHINIYDYIK